MRGAKIKGPTPEPQDAIPVEKGIFDFTEFSLEFLNLHFGEPFLAR